MEAWAADAALLKSKPGFISTQLHRGTAGSTTFINVAVWESARALGRAFGSPEFQARAARYPDSTVAAPHVFTKLAVPGICVAWRACIGAQLGPGPKERPIMPADRRDNNRLWPPAVAGERTWSSS